VDGTFYVLEQIPGLMLPKDMTDTLNTVASTFCAQFILLGILLAICPYLMKLMRNLVPNLFMTELVLKNFQGQKILEQ
jgi:hypothetical protein